MSGPAPNPAPTPAPTPAPEDTPGVVVHPPILYAGALVAGLIVDAATGTVLGVGAPWRLTLAAALGAAGLALGGWAALHFRRARTPVPTFRPTTALVEGGPYRLSRNPIYVALTALYAAIALAADAPVTLALLVPVLAVMRYGVVAREERYLEARFGDSYRDYRRRTRRWL